MAKNDRRFVESPVGCVNVKHIGSMTKYGTVPTTHKTLTKGGFDKCCEGNKLCIYVGGNININPESLSFICRMYKREVSIDDVAFCPGPFFKRS